MPFWQLPELHEPVGPEQLHVWHWDEVVPELLRSRDLEDGDAGATQRRALLLRNPGLPPGAFGATPTLAAAYQMLAPGESAPVHCHSFSALRFGAEGTAARMVVDGERFPLDPGDLLLTPAWSWHGHAHGGGDEPVAWFDGLDVPYVVQMRAGFYRSAPPAAPLTVEDSTGTLPAGIGLAPVDQRSTRNSPIRRYPWAEAHAALQRQLARCDDEHGVAIEYRNPLTGGPALATIACQLQGLPAGGCSRTTRETAGSVCFVARGSGAIVTDGRRQRFSTNDVLAVPAWTWHRVCAGDEELVLFRMPTARCTTPSACTAARRRRRGRRGGARVHWPPRPERTAGRPGRDRAAASDSRPVPAR